MVIDGKKSPSLKPPPHPPLPLQNFSLAGWTHRERNMSHPIPMTKWLIGIRMLTFFDQQAVPLNQIRRRFWKQGRIWETMTVLPPKGRLGWYAWTVWGSLYSSAMSPHGGGLIGGPKEPPVLSPVLTKTSGCGCVEDGGGRGGEMERRTGFP